MDKKSKNSIERRAVLRMVAGGLAVGLVTSVAWQFRPTTPAEFPEYLPDGQGSRGPKLLLVYGSMMGSTGEQADWIAQAARAKGMRVHLARAETAPAPGDFDAVILGSAIRASAWLDPVIDWAVRHGSELARKPHGLFQCSMTCAGFRLANSGGHLSREQIEKLSVDLGTLHAAVPALSQSPVAFFPGRLEFHRLSPTLRFGYPIVSGSMLRGDYRLRDEADEYGKRFARGLMS